MKEIGKGFMNSPNFNMTLWEGSKYDEIQAVFSENKSKELTELVNKIIYEKTDEDLVLVYAPEQEKRILCACGGATAQHRFVSDKPKAKAVIYRFSLDKAATEECRYRILAWWDSDIHTVWEGDTKIAQAEVYSG